MANRSDDLLAGRYRILKRLGSGGMATVFLAEDTRLGRKVAVKRMHAESPDEVAKRFRREAQLGASLNHPNIVSIFDIETDDENVLIVMEYVDGGTLKDALARGPLPLAAAIPVLEGIASALDYAHEHGVVHRDVKPANVLLDAHGSAKLADLGIATAAEVTKVTATGSVLGTAAYMAPERLDGHAGGPPVDVYGLATLAYEALTGRKARQGRSAVEIAHAVMGEPPPDLRKHFPEAPAAAADVLARGMARDPAERPATAGELVRELSAAFDRTEPTAALLPEPPLPTGHPPPATRDRSPVTRRWLAPVMALGVLVAAVALVLAMSGDDGGGSGTTSQSTRAEQRRTTTEKTQSQPERAPTPPAQAQASPEEAVKDLYTRAAAGDFESAWQLAGPGFRQQIGGYQSFVDTLQSLESIEFPKLTATIRSGDTATVAFESVATHTDRVDHCTGTANLSVSGDQWLVQQINPSCNQESPAQQNPGKGPAGGKPKKWKNKDRGDENGD
ncbi:MAG: eukaryotic-like serine/threonine-protein kinase [Solirubrobacteraceae bacterium]|nr:eukaryotic-like serine/threonine-protein kinase [Solirubrobacteraceae bacterium]